MGVKTQIPGIETLKNTLAEREGSRTDAMRGLATQGVARVLNQRRDIAVFEGRNLAASFYGSLPGVDETPNTAAMAAELLSRT